MPLCVLDEYLIQTYLFDDKSHFIKFKVSVRFENVCLFLPCLSVKAIEVLLTEIESTGKFTVISCPLILYDIGHTPFNFIHP